MLDPLNHLIELSKCAAHTSLITLAQLTHAKQISSTLPNTKQELLLLLASFNLINAALKRKEFISPGPKAIIYYGMLKPRVSKLLEYLLEQGNQFTGVEFYIDTNKNCAYIEVDSLQFSFHNIKMTPALNTFVNSSNNLPKAWKRITLQRIAGELFEFSLK